MARLNGLTDREVKELQLQYGKNEIISVRKRKVTGKLVHILAEPIYGLLAGAAVIYFVLGERTEGLLMLAFVLFVIGIDLLQEIRTGNTLRKLKTMSAPMVKVIRNGTERNIHSFELVPGDVMLVSEGVKIPADGRIIYSNGLCVDESILTGEAEGVWKHTLAEGREEAEEFYRKDYCYAGSLVTLGNGTVIVEKTGNRTEYGQLAEALDNAGEEESLLQKKMGKLAGGFTRISLVFLLLVGIVTYINMKDIPLRQRLIESFLAGVVLALSMIPGEFPVIQSVFLSMGALRLAKKHALVRRLSAVETLGYVSVLCVDKTGTITDNRMEVKEFWHTDHEGNGLCRAVALACREDTYDPMEKAMLRHCGVRCIKGKLESECVKACILTSDRGRFLWGYPFTNELKAMGQVWQFGKENVIAIKGSFETVLPLCVLTREQEEKAKNKAEKMSEEGLRVIAVAEMAFPASEKIPASLMACRPVLKGLIGLYDPPRENIALQTAACYRAGIRIIMITGDHPKTAGTIAKQAGIRVSGGIITGNELTGLSDRELRETVKHCNVFARVLPLHKMRIVKALKDNGEITAMTGDGVNDSTALKIADIGIAMGKHGSEVSREAADLILLDDNLQTILDSVADGRRIYQNITKTIGYIIAIHLPIALISLTAPLMGIPKESLMLLPLHIVLMELVMDPTCSVALERQPAEENIMEQPPKKPEEKLMTTRIFMKSLLQGLVIFGVSFLTYLGFLNFGYPAAAARSFGFSILILSNSFLVLVNCSEKESILHTIQKLRKERGIWLLNLIIAAELCLILYTPVSGLLALEPLPPGRLLSAVLLSALSALWYEAVKWVKRSLHP